MLSDRTRLALFDIRDNIALARSIVGDLPEATFRADKRTFYAAAVETDIADLPLHNPDPTA
ncbi:hypothetical protein [Rhodopila sp.]|uniref:hypothetical protein n=1 Tax=Rhodopila sp. TaxID=2480087 RepID=UPI003D138CEE